MIQAGDLQLFAGPAAGLNFFHTSFGGSQKRLLLGESEMGVTFIFKEIEVGEI